MSSLFSDAMPFEAALAGQRVFVTGHTGFTGSWMTLWLKAIGAEVHGFSLKPETDPAMFYRAGLDTDPDVHSVYGDIGDFELLQQSLRDSQPAVVLHLAAQPLVRLSYRKPLETFAVNAQGTAHVLEAARHVKSVRAVVCVTTDKVYKNNEWPWPYRENDPLGGKDPYSASKAAAEMVIQSFAASYPFQEQAGPPIATARGGNIIGGGDWSEDRLVPDFVRAVTQQQPMTLRYPDATRPWQHVLGLAQGYMMLMAGLLSDDPGRYARAWNLGPQDLSQHSVRSVLEWMCAEWQRPDLRYMDNPLPEAGALALDSSLAANLLGWRPAWDAQRVARETAAWYRAFYEQPENCRDITMQQIATWRRDLANAERSAGA